MSLTLAELIEKFRDGKSLVTLAAACGGVPSRSRIWQIQAQEMKEWPTPEIMRGLARGLGVPVESVVFASALSLGFDLGVPPLVQSVLGAALPESAHGLSPLQVAAVVGVVEAMVSGSAS